MPRQIGGIWFGVGVAIGWLGGIVFQYASLWTEEGFPLSSEHTLLVLLAAGLVLTCIRRTCSFGIGALVSLPFAPLLVFSRLVDLISPLLLLLG
ncbi:hypothetical protein E3O41_11295 [Microbacterium sediminis]|nr:hypothetical protein E3O41_11295 [Microbacterium sediminis]